MKDIKKKPWNNEKGKQMFYIYLENLYGINDGRKRTIGDRG